MSVNPISFQTSAKQLPNLEQLRWSRPEPLREHRGIFSKDRDRILYSKSFLRLRGKTQVFMLQYNDYIRTRLTNTLEVNQIAKSLAIALGQNPELTEAFALGHDVGHTPFGLIGERTLCELIKDEAVISVEKKGFKHNLQAFLKNSVLTSFQAQTMDVKGAYIIKLYQAFKSNPCQLPDTALRSFFQFIGEEYKRANTNEMVIGNEAVLYRCIVDYIGGMTDQYAYNEYDRLYGTKF